MPHLAASLRLRPPRLFVAGSESRVTTYLCKRPSFALALYKPPLPQQRFQSTIPVSNISITSPTSTNTLRSVPVAPVNKLLQQKLPLASLPLTHLLRSLLLHTVSSSPILLSLTTRILLKHIDSLSHPLSPLRYLIRKTFYEHFCAGENEKEVRYNGEQLKALGINGVCLSYAREVKPGEGEGQGKSTVDTGHSSQEVTQWIDGTLKTIQYSSPGDFVAVKFTGGGDSVNRLLMSDPPKDPSVVKQLENGIAQMAELAISRGVKLAIDAEHTNVQRGIHKWALDLMRKYNKNPGKKAWIFNTYQMYLKESPKVLQEHMELARTEGWKMGIKLVRGAYLAYDPRDLICETKEETDKQYDKAVDKLMAETEVGIELMLGTHNKESVMRAVEAYSKQKPEKSENKGRGGVDDFVVAQLQGMADELSFGLVGMPTGAVTVPERSVNGRVVSREGLEVEIKVYKYVVWGTIPECVRYLLRRAEENKEAVGRSKENVLTCLAEVKRRLRILG